MDCEIDFKASKTFSDEFFLQVMGWCDLMAKSPVVDATGLF